MSFVSDWGSTPAERDLPLPCDPLLPGAGWRLHRAITIGAPAALVFRWLCQLRRAPYSYDLLDNFGRRSPQQLTPGLDELETGQRFMSMFGLASFSPDEHVTLRARRVAVTYAVRPDGDATRLLVRILYDGRGGLALAIGDLVMMRRQLLNLKRLAERDASTARALGFPDGCAPRRRPAAADLA